MEISKTVIFCTPEQYETDVRPTLLKLGNLPEVGAMNPMQPIHVGVIVFSDGHFNLCVDDWMKLATDYESLSCEEFLDLSMTILEAQSIIFLRERGFATMCLWSVRDVKHYCDIPDDEAMEVLDDILNNKLIVNLINDEIHIKTERFRKPSVEK